MKKGVHPTYYHDAKVICACGNTFITGSTKKEIKVEVCSACHPFFTGAQKFIDTQGRVERFQAKQKVAGTYVKKARRQHETEKSPKSLKEMLKEAKTKSKKK